MMTDNSLSQQTANSLQSLPFGSIIGAPLKACIEAQAMAAQTSWKFIEEVGLLTDPQTGEKEVVNVSFIFKHQGQTSQVSIPLLTIVPVPYLAVKTVDINFKANITASKATEVSEKTTTEDEGNLTAKGKLKLGVFSLNTQFQASYSSKKDSKSTQESRYSVEYTMDVAIKAAQDDMPAGLAKMLEILDKGLEVIPVNQ